MKRPQHDLAQEKPTLPEASDLEADVGLAERAWLDMRDAPRDGTLIEYEPGKTARYRITRRRDAEHRRWEVIGFWSDPISREELSQEPTRWRLPEGYLTPGMVI